MTERDRHERQQDDEIRELNRNLDEAIAYAESLEERIKDLEKQPKQEIHHHHNYTYPRPYYTYYPQWTYTTGGTSGTSGGSFGTGGGGNMPPPLGNG